METIYGVFSRTTKELQYGPTILSKQQETLNARAVYSDLQSHYKLSVVGQATRASTLNALDLQLVDWKGNDGDDPYSWNCTYKRVKFYLSDSNKKQNMSFHTALKKNITPKLRKVFSTKATSTNKVVYNVNSEAWRNSKLLCNSGTTKNSLLYLQCKCFQN